jgi:enterochelin esterase family protein
VKFKTAILILGAACTAAAQAPGRGAPPVKSPEVSADGKVTFRLRAPNAREVVVTGIGQQRIAMQKDEQGVWSATTDTLKPDIYTYSFSADGITLNDPGNPLFKTSYGSAGSSLVHVPGAVSWEPAPGVARGAVTRHFYHSVVAGDDRDY